ncbi:MAG TPA: 4,5-DOPA dioxygenase extradiol [Rhodanobacteraceae bacterium]|nr:4,5-DOPA dioxygenase extradiol [Rhodanobacteraceae bacterium]
MTDRMPVVFFGHGNPMNAVNDTEWSRSWALLGQQLPRPRAVLSISAHWFVPETAVTAMAMPRTIHDFGGFPRELFEVQYPAPGDPALAARVEELLAPVPVRADPSWGLDHGTWSVLCHVFPEADVPVVQLSIDATQAPEFHYELGRRLAPLRDEGVLVIGSGNVVHNLHTYAWGRHPAQPLDWAARFDATVRDLVQQNDHHALVNYASLGRDAGLSIPTPEHYLPLLYVLGASEKGETASFPAEGIEGGSISMLSIRFG